MKSNGTHSELSTAARTQFDPENLAPLGLSPHVWGFRGRTPALRPIQKVKMRIADVTHAGQDVTRDMVHSVLNRVVNGRRWKDVDEMLRMAQFQYRIDVVRGANNQVLYRKAQLT